MNSIVNSLILIAIFITIECKNNRPLIAVLSQDRYNKEGQSFIVASYVKYLESAGARVVPVLINQDLKYYETIVNQTDGLLIPGGGQDLHTSGFAKAGQMIWNYTLSDRFSRLYPIWGTCLGFELLITLIDTDYKFDTCDAIDVSNQLTFTNEGKNSQIFGGHSNIVDILEKENVTYNYHKKCILKNNTTDKFNKFFDVLTTTADKNGLEYISTIESKREHKYRVYGTQWHPEKNMFEFAVNTSIPHTSNAVLISQYMANFFVDQIRQLSTRDMLRLDIEHKLLIYNYHPVYTGAKYKYEYEQIYYFNTSQSNLWFVSLPYYSILFIILALIL